MTACINAFNQDLFRARVHFDLRHNRLSSDNWEKAIAESTGSRWIKGSADLADAVHAEHKICISVKSRKIDPQIKKRVRSRDFFSDPGFFHHGGTVFSEGDLDNLHTVSGRCSIPGLDEQKSIAQDIGKMAVGRYHDFEQKSLEKFQCDATLDVVIVHGESADGRNYLLRVMFFDHELNDITRWEDVKFLGPRTKYHGYRSMVLGYDSSGPHIGRISNLGRQQTCMLRFYRQAEAIKILDMKVPMPTQEKFIFEKELEKIK